MKNSETMQQRVDSLDWLRGLLAVSIMVYHLTSWEISVMDAGSLIGRLGIYGVSMFFILSGLSIAMVYHRCIADISTSVKFLVRRIFRIWPLLWLAIIVTTGTRLLLGQDPQWKLVLLNLTTIFGFVRPWAYINTGAWSIGNEMVYYALTPIIIFIYNRSIFLGNIVTVFAIGIGLFFSHVILSIETSLVAQWHTYINPFNNLFLYCSGIAIYYNANKLIATRLQCLAALIIATIIFMGYPVEGDTIHIVTGWSRIFFCIASVMAVLAFYKYPATIPDLIAIPLTQLGVATYGVYLLHPVIWQTFGPLYKQLGFPSTPLVSISVTMTLTLVAAWLIYHYYEIPMINLGKRLTSVRQKTVDASLDSRHHPSSAR
jgi:peptidoglycan/LPS O-acetylase OafA/YrhL